jgi:hypothetical protein
VRPTLCVVTESWRRPLYSLAQARHDAVLVWVFGPGTDDGEEAVSELADRVYVLLHMWQEPTTRFAVRFQDAIGSQAAVLADGALQRLRFIASGVPKGVRG